MKYYCYKCHVYVAPVKGQTALSELLCCPHCKKPLWDAEAKHNDNKLRTTKASYKAPETEKGNKSDGEETLPQ